VASVFRQHKADGKPYPCWRFKYRHYSGKWKYGTGWPSKKKTLEHAHSLEADHRAVARGEKTVPPEWKGRGQMPVDKVLGEYLSWGVVRGGVGGRPWEPQNAGTRLRVIQQWIETLGVETMSDISLQAVDSEYTSMMKRFAKSTARRYAQILKTFCEWAKTRGYISENPLASLKVGGTTEAECPHRAFTTAEIGRLFAEADAEHLLWYKTALATGYRVDELRSLTVDSLRPGILFLDGEFTKNRKNATQPIPTSLWKELAASVKGYTADSPLFDMPRRTYKPLDVDRKRARIQKVTKEGKASWHSLRKAFVTQLIRSGADVKTVQRLARHSSAALTLDVYTAADPALERSMVEDAVGELVG
jgi:integrase